MIVALLVGIVIWFVVARRVADKYPTTNERRRRMLVELPDLIVVLTASIENFTHHLHQARDALSLFEKAWRDGLRPENGYQQGEH